MKEGRTMYRYLEKNTYDKSYPYTIRFRLIGERNYEKVKPQNFIELAKTKLLH